jgi:catechol 2,3-dioxygenase-like lactoylglutathione lyase family enzyme
MPIRIGLLICVLASTMVCGQAPGLADPPSTPAASFAAVTGIFNWIHSTADVDRGYAFYHEVFGLEMVNAPFGAIPGAPPPNTIRSRAEAIADPIIGNLTNTNGARFRNVFMRLPGAEFGLELSEFNDIESKSVRPNFWDPGATSLILQVRDIEKVFAALGRAGAPVITLGAAPVDIRAQNRRARSILVRDPDGYLIQVIQAAQSAGTSMVVGGDSPYPNSAPSSSSIETFWALLFQAMPHSKAANPLFVSSALRKANSKPVPLISQARTRASNFINSRT